MRLPNQFAPRTSFAIALGLALTILAMTPADSHAAGLWNMPTTLRQCMGAGLGPGYHAPIAKGPWYKSTVERQGIVRLRNAPQPPMPAHHAGHYAVDYSHSTIPAMPASHGYYSEPTMAAPGTTIFEAPAMAPRVQPVPRSTASGATAPASAAVPQAEAVKKPAPNKPAEPASPSDSLRPDPLPLPPR